MTASKTRLLWAFIAAAAFVAAGGRGTIWADEPAAAVKATVPKNPPDKSSPPLKSAPDAAGNSGTVTPEKHNSRVVFIITKNCPQCDEALTRLRQPGGDFDHLKAAGWLIGEGPENHIQIIDRDTIPELVQKLGAKEFPVVACIDNGEVVRYFKSGCTTPLDMWTLCFLAKGVNDRPPGMVPEAARVASTGSYPLRGNHWSVEGDWNPTREKVIEHLHGPNHASELEPQWHIDLWSYEELRSLHDDLHERYDTPTTQSPPDTGFKKWK